MPPRMKDGSRSRPPVGLLPRNGLHHVAPKAPVSEWTLDDVVRVLDEGRSVHWRALARVHRRDETTFGILLAEALTLTTNQAARDYLHRVLPQQ